MREKLRRFPVAVIRPVAFIVTLAASAITTLNYTESLPPWEDVRSYDWGTALEALLSNPWVVYPGVLALIGWTGIAVAKWWETWARWVLIPVKYTSVRSLSIHRGSEGREQALWYQCKLTKQDGSEWMQYTTAVVEPNRTPEQGNRIEDRSILCIVDRDIDTAAQ